MRFEVVAIHGAEVQWGILLLMLFMAHEVGSVGCDACSGATSVFQCVSLTSMYFQGVSLAKVTPSLIN